MVDIERCRPGVDIPVFEGGGFPVCALHKLHRKKLTAYRNLQQREPEELANSIRSEGSI